MCTMFTIAFTKDWPPYSARSLCVVAVNLKHLCPISLVRSTLAMELTLERTFVQNALLLIFLFHHHPGLRVFVRAATR